MHRGEDHDPRPPPPAWIEALERRQGWLFVPLIAGLIAWPLFGVRPGLSLVGASVAAAGLVPVLSGRYISGPFRLYGVAARLRGMVSVGIGAGLIAVARAIGS